MEDADGSTAEEPLLSTVLSPAMCALLSPAPHPRNKTEVVPDSEVWQENPVDCHAEHVVQTSSWSVARGEQNLADLPAMPPADALPAWWQNLRSIFDSDAVTEHLEEGPILYFLTWFLHGRTHRQCQAPRVLRLDQFWHHWLRDLRDLWHDTLAPETTVSVGIVRPMPPLLPGRYYAGHLILHQDTDLHSVGVYTTIFHGWRRNGISQTALLMPLRSTVSAIATTLRARPHVRDLDEVSFMAAGVRDPNLHPAPVPVIENAAAVEQDDVVIDVDEAAELSESVEEEDSESSDDRAWYPVTVFSPSQGVGEGVANWVNHNLYCQNVASIMNVPLHQVRQVYHIRWPPANIRTSRRQALILEKHDDLPIGSRHKLVLIDVEFHPHRPSVFVEFVRAVYAVPEMFTRSNLLTFLGLAPYCELMRQRCLVWRNGDLVPLQALGQIQPEHGDFLRVVVPPTPTSLNCLPTRPTARMAQLGVPRGGLFRYYTNHDFTDDLQDMPTLGPFIDDIRLYQTSISLQPRVCHRDADPAELREQYVREGAGVRPDPEPWTPLALGFERDLFLRWAQFARPGAGGVEEVMKIRTWYNDHERFPICAQARDVSLYEDVGEWRRELLRTWSDHVDQSIVVDFVIVEPDPIEEADDVAGHLILLQRPMPEARSVVVTVLDSDIWNGLPRRWALRSSADPTGDELIALMGYRLLCPPHVPTTECRVWCRGHEIGMDDRLITRNGMALTVTIHRHHAGDDDDAAFLQTDVRPGRAMPLPPPLNPGPAVEASEDLATRVCFRKVWHLFEQLDSHFFLPQFDVQVLLAGHLALPWTTSWWSFDMPCFEIRLYTDGSFARHPAEGEAPAGAAVAAFVRTQYGWHFAGALSSALPAATSAYLAELTGITTAVKFAYDLVKVHRHLFGTAPSVTVCYDAQTVGYQASGAWQCISHPALGRLLRSFVLFVESFLPGKLEFEHVPGHHGEPGNEMVDVLAGAARQGNELSPFASWIAHVTKFADEAEWLWALFDYRFVGMWSGFDLVLPASAPVPPGNFLPDCGQAHDVEAPVDASHESPLPSRVEVHLRCATCNVLSLKGTKEDQTQMAGVARQQALFYQLAQEEILIFGLQETRLKKLHSAHDDAFFLFRSAATPQGHYGIMMGFAKNQPYASSVLPDSHRPTHHYFQEGHFAILGFDPRYLIVKVAAPHLRIVVAAIHAPHTGNEAELIDEWWETLHLAIPLRYRSWPLVLLCDANASVGAETSVHVGDFQASRADEKASGFLEFLAKHDLWLPATFEEHQCGPGETWSHSTGSRRRLDYVALPRVWQVRTCQAWVSSTIDVSILRPDHAAACAEVRFDSTTSEASSLRPRSTLNHLDCAQISWDSLGDSTPWHQDVHSHLAGLQDKLVNHLQRQCPRPARRPVKQTMSPSTWELVCTKRAWKQTWFEYRRLQRRSVLEQIFCSWRDQRACSLPEYDRLHTMQDGLIAGAMWQFRRLSRMVLTAMRADDRAFFAGLASDGAEFLNPKHVKDLWRVVRRSLPKFRARREGYNPHRLACLDAQWARHVCELEIGHVIDGPRLSDHCVQVQDAARHGQPARVELCALPSLSEFEAALRATRMDRSTGLDPIPSTLYHKQAAFLGQYFYRIVLKMFVWGREPLQGKGGVLKMIHKRPGALDVKGFRGILLLPTLAKRVHAMMRTRLMKQAHGLRDQGQLGGFPGQEVMYGSQLLRTLSRVFHAKQWSSAVVFVDLSTAFHHLVRELVSGVGDLSDYATVLHALQSSSSPLEADQHGRALVGILETSAVDPLLIRLLRDIHQSTWFSLSSAGDRIIQTHRGTRPGSPLADAVFHLLMGDLARELRIWLSEQASFVELMTQLQMDPVVIIWSDDFAIPWACATAEKLVSEVEVLMVQLHSLFQARGFEVNYAPGKTAAVLSFVGPRAPEMRRCHLLQPRPGIEITLHSGRKQWLHFALKYKHLGTIFAASHPMDPELRQRIGMAKSAFAQTSKMVVCNRHYPLKVRLGFLQSLIFSRLFFGLGAWTTPTLQQLGLLRTAYHAMLRKVLRGAPDERISIQQLLLRTGAVDVRVRLALDRLLYARRLFQVGPADLQQVLHLERGLCANAWLEGLEADLQWLKQTLPMAIPLEVGSDFSDWIDLWQGDTIPWKCLLKRAVRQHKLQEEMMAEVQADHQRLLRILRAAGASFAPDYEQVVAADRIEEFPCPECSRSFSTSQGRALHRLKQHGVHAPEHAFLAGDTCPACLKFCWSSNRLAMHLSYMPRGGGPNKCFALLSKQALACDSHAVALPPSLRGAVRLDALQAAGPLDCPEVRFQRHVMDIDEQISGLQREIDEVYMPEEPETVGLHLGEALTHITQRWVALVQRSSLESAPSIVDLWLRALCSLDSLLDDWTANVFVDWGRLWLPAIIEALIDGELEAVLDAAFAETCQLLPRAEIEGRITFLRQRKRRLEDDWARPDQPHRPVRKGTANARERAHTVQSVPSLFRDQPVWHSLFRQIQWFDLPSGGYLPILSRPGERPQLLIVHLFSGRRRVGDFHWHLQQLGQVMRLDFVILSMDTAVSTYWGDLHRSSEAWRHLMLLYQHGLVAGTLVGSPCETYSEARYVPAPPGATGNWPRPLRSHDFLYGLPGLCRKELKQVQLGTSFFLQGLETLCHHIRAGGVFMSEHPGVPSDESRPSTWRAGITQLLRAHCDVRFSQIQQWEWGAASVKPTGILTHKLPWGIRSLRKCVLPHVRRPNVVSIGRDEHGEFKTEKLKEYPWALSEGMARAFGDQIVQDVRMGRGVQLRRAPGERRRGAAVAEEAVEAAVVGSGGVHVPGES
eukprot:s70_g47.t1